MQYPPPPTPQAGGSEAAAMGAFAIVGYAIADWLSLPGLIAAAIGMAAAYGVGFLLAQKDWAAYCEARARETQTVSHDA